MKIRGEYYVRYEKYKNKTYNCGSGCHLTYRGYGRYYDHWCIYVIEQSGRQLGREI